MQQEAAVSFSAVYSLAAFASNFCHSLDASKLSQAEVSVLSSLLDAGMDISQLGFQKEVENLDATLARAIRQSSVRSISLIAPKDFGLAASLIGPRLESLWIRERYFGANESKALRQALEQAGMLSGIVIYDCRVLSGKEFVAAIHAAVSLQDLDLFGAEMDDETLAELVGGEMSRKMKKLSVAHSSDYGTKYAAAAAMLSSRWNTTKSDWPDSGRLPTQRRRAARGT